MRRFAGAVLLLCTLALQASAEVRKVSSPDGKLVVSVAADGGRLEYSVSYDGRQMIEPSALGVETSVGNFSDGVAIAGAEQSRISRRYSMRNAKAANISYEANRMDVKCVNGKKQAMTVTFCVSDRDVAFRYEFPLLGKDTRCMVVNRELTAFRLPEGTTTFLSPQSEAMVGWMRTKPSYEEVYTADARIDAKSAFGQGYVFPCLFRVADQGWVQISETGTNGGYAGCHLTDYNPQTGYQIAFPMPGENNGIGSATPAVQLPGATPWRTITVGATLKPIVETTVAYDVVEPQYEPSEAYRPGRYTWSWLIWQDNATVYDDQVKFIDLAADMGYEYCLVDGLWDEQIGRPKIEELSRYARSKGVNLMLWYNSNGSWNNAPQGPRGCMNTAVARQKEMAWMQSIGVKGIKVDFFGGDKQCTMQLYEDILSDANRFGLQVIFHGCTLPRGWERMYPNFVASEAVLASENVYFDNGAAKREAYDLTMHPFCRNAVASMDWGGTMMNRRMSRDNKSRHPRYTSDVFEMAAAIVNQTRIQCIAIQPNNLGELPQFELDFLKTVPTEWQETRYIDGYPGRYVVLARRSHGKWYVAGLNATDKPLTLRLQLPMMAGRTAKYYNDKPAKAGQMPDAQLASLKVDAKGMAKVTIQPNGGLIIVD